MKELKCIFCDIAKKMAPAKIVYEDNHIMSFHDINPIAPVHILFIPKMHISGLFIINDDDIDLMGRMTLQASKIAKEFELFGGYRLVMNCGKDGLQDVKHLHIHLMGGRTLIYPIG
jgi:histidine triad (HIT) family protein